MIAYLDTPSGISGDMFLGCLLDAGWTVDRLRFVIGQLRVPAEEYAVEARAVIDTKIEMDAIAYKPLA